MFEIRYYSIPFLSKSATSYRIMLWNVWLCAIKGRWKTCILQMLLIGELSFSRWTRWHLQIYLRMMTPGILSSPLFSLCYPLLSSPLAFSLAPYPSLFSPCPPLFSPPSPPPASPSFPSPFLPSLFSHVCLFIYLFIFLSASEFRSNVIMKVSSVLISREKKSRKQIPFNDDKHRWVSNE